jgi:hypothetical protein
MADTKRSGSRRLTQRPPEAPASETILRVSKYTSIFEAIANLNRAFDEVLQGVERSKRMGFFRGEISNRIPKLPADARGAAGLGRVRYDD